jgi:hypothetical protein
MFTRLELPRCTEVVGDCWHATVATIPCSATRSSPDHCPSSSEAQLHASSGCRRGDYRSRGQGALPSWAPAARPLQASEELSTRSLGWECGRVTSRTRAEIARGLSRPHTTGHARTPRPEGGFGAGNLREGGRVAELSRRRPPGAEALERHELPGAAGRADQPEGVLGPPGTGRWFARPA